MRIIGIDPGTETTGYGVVEETPAGPVSLAHGVIRTRRSLGAGERLLEVYRGIRDLLQDHRPQRAVVERLFMGVNNRPSAMSVGQARGVILLALAEREVPLLELTPSGVKRAVAGYGRADKGQVGFMVRSILRLQEVPRPDDAADALAMAIAGLYSLPLGETGQ